LNKRLAHGQPGTVISPVTVSRPTVSPSPSDRFHCTALHSLLEINRRPREHPRALVLAHGCDEPKGNSTSGKGEPMPQPAKSEPLQPMSATNPVLLMETSMGKIKIELFADEAPITVDNFLKYANDKFYDGTVFHRVIPNFMVQGGGFTPGMKEKKTQPPIKNESSNGVPNKRGTLAMARTPAPDSASSQFFINVKDNSFLNKKEAQDGVGYCVFGRVLEGMDVVDKIVAVPTGNVGGHGNVPVADVAIKSVRRVDKQ
jgi:cyclophilin family peptidyl-prolyl cis-trans isomerase